jgi:hypothetical protein
MAAAKTTTTTAAEPELEPLEAPRSQPIDITKIRDGHLMAIVQYVRVNRVFKSYNGEHAVNLTDLDAQVTWDRSGNNIIQPMLSADQYSEEREVTRTELVRDVFMLAFNQPMTVCFRKNDKKGVVGQGDERVLRGRLVAPDPTFGQSTVEDLDIDASDAGGRLRKVTHSTIDWLIVGGIKYTVRGAKKSKK